MLAEGIEKRGFEYFFLVLGYEADLDRGVEQPFSQGFRHFLVVAQSLAVLFGRGYESCRPFLGSQKQASDIHPGVFVMVIELEMLDHLIVVAEVSSQWRVGSYS